MYKVVVIDMDSKEEIENIECDGLELGFFKDKEDDSMLIDGFFYNCDKITHRHLNIMFEDAYEND